MSFNTNPGRAEYTATASQTIFTFVFKIYAATDIKVYKTPSGETPDDAADLLTLTTDYTVTINGDDGGIITLTSGADDGDSITLVRDLPVTRTIEYQELGDLFAETINIDQDYQTYLVLDQSTSGGRYLTLQESSQNLSNTLPQTVNNGYLKVNSEGTAYEYSTLEGSEFEDLVTVDTVDDLSNIDTSLFSTAIVKDVDRGGIFIYDASQSAVNNSGTIFNGWVRQYAGAVNVKWFGAVGDGITDNTIFIQNALNSDAEIAYISDGESGYVVDGNISIPDGKTLKGEYEIVDPRAGTKLNNYTSRILLNSAASFILNESSSISNLCIVRKGQIIPADDTNLNQFAGTAITTTASTHGHYIGYCGIYGFEYAIYTEDTTNTEQTRCEYVMFDCTNGIVINYAADIVYIENCNGWPTLSIEARNYAPLHTDLERSGKGFWLNGTGRVGGVDWGKLINCFAYGYQRGFVVQDANSVTLTGCGADNTTLHTGSIGFEVSGTSTDTNLVSCQSAAQDTAGYFINGTNGANTSLIGCDCWGSTTDHGILIYAGDVSINDGVIRDSSYGITLTAATFLTVSNTRFANLLVAPINAQVANQDIYVSDIILLDANDGISIDYNKNIQLPTIASADPLLLPPNGNVFYVSGTTNFGTISQAYSGREITLIFLDTLTMFDGGANLKLNGSFITTTDDTIKLVAGNNNDWFELSRSAN